LDGAALRSLLRRHLLGFLCCSMFHIPGLPPSLVGMKDLIRVNFPQGNSESFRIAPRAFWFVYLCFSLHPSKLKFFPCLRSRNCALLHLVSPLLVPVPPLKTALLLAPLIDLFVFSVRAASARTAPIAPILLGRS